MHAGKVAGAAFIVALALALPASAAAGTATYAGHTDSGAKVAFDATLKHGKPKTITELRAAKFLLHCDISGDVKNNSLQLPVSLPVKNSEFALTFVQPTYGNKSRVTGAFDGDTATGKFKINYHFLADGQYPEEDCHSDKLSYTVRKGAPDHTQPG